MAETYKIQRKKEDGTMEDVILQGASSGSGVSFIAEEGISITSVGKVALKWSVDGVNNVTTPTDGMVIALRVPVSSGSGYGVVLSIDGGTTYYPLVKDANTKIYTDLAAGSTPILTFNASQTVSGVKLSESGGTTVTGCWQLSDKDTDKFVKQNYVKNDDNYTLLFRGSSGLTLTGSSTNEVSYTNNIYANPSTGTIYANDFVVDGKSIVSGGGSANAPIATTQIAGIVKPDGETITVDTDGTIHAAVGSGVITYLSLQSNGVRVEEIDETGIIVDIEEIEIEYDNGNSEYVYFPGKMKLPLIAGDNVAFEHDTENGVVKISATGGGGGDGQPLYRHCIKVYEEGQDAYNIFIQLVSTSNEAVNTEEKLRAILGTDEFACQCTGTFMLDGSSITANAIVYLNDQYFICDDIYLQGTMVSLFNTEIYQLAITDSVTLIGTASVGGGGGNANLTMPIIRMGPVSDVNGTMVISQDNPLTFTAEVIGGNLQVGDVLQLCAMKLYTYWNEERTGKIRKYKMRTFCNHEITEEDLEKRYISITIEDGYQFRNLLRGGGRYSSTVHNYYPKYMRIRRVHPDNPDNALFSNAIPFQAFGKSYYNGYDDDGNPLWGSVGVVSIK